jgi:hypothetical protein
MITDNNPNKFLSQNNVTGQVLSATPTFLRHIVCFNSNGAARYVKLYNKTTPPTVGTDPTVQTYLVPGNTAGAGCVIPLPVDGIFFSAGLGLGITTGAADNDNGAPAANEVIVSYSTCP